MPPESLTLDAAVSLLDAAPPVVEEAPVVAAQPVEVETPPVEGAPEIPAEPEAEQPDAPEEASEEVAEEVIEPELPAIDPPRSWDTEGQAEFAKLPRALQTLVVEREAERERAVNSALQQSAEARKGIEADVAKINQLSTELAEFLPQALKTFESKWGQAPDWNAVLAQHGVEEYTRMKLEFDTERQQLGELTRQENNAKALAHTAFVKAEFEKLPTVAPELADPVKGTQLRADVAKYAVEQGYATPADLPHVSAAQLSMAHKAMRWDALPDAVKAGQLPAMLKTLQPTPKPATPAARPAVRPTAAAPVSSQTQVTKQLAARFTASRSLDDAVAMLNARK